MLGHASAAMTLDVYAGLFPDDLYAVALSLDLHVPQMCHCEPLGLIEGELRMSDAGPDLRKRVVPPARFELATPALGERCSIP